MNRVVCHFLIFFIFILINISSKSEAKTKHYKPNKHSINPGEELTYNAYYSIFKIAEIKSVVDSNIYNIYLNQCYKVDVYATINSFLKIFTSIDEIFGAYIDTITLRPVTSYRYLKEGNYTHDEICYYSYEKNKMILTTFNKQSLKYEQKDTLPLHNFIFDVIGMYVNFRDIDFKKLPPGSIILTNMYIEDKMFPISFVIDKYETIKVKAGKFKSIKLVPKLSDNGLFDNDHKMELWISNDDNNLILQAKAKMKFGNATIKLKSFKRTKNIVSSKL